MYRRNFDGEFVADDFPENVDFDNLCYGWMFHLFQQ